MNINNSEIDRKHMGAYGELVACAWLLSRGYEVYRNVSAHGRIDVVAMKGGEILKLNIRTMNSGHQGKLPESDIKNGILPLFVDKQGNCFIEFKPKILYTGEKRNCASCNKEFIAYRSNKTYCNHVCYVLNNQNKAKVK